jgi:hypothetical protein
MNSLFLDRYLDVRLRDSLVAHNAPMLFNSMPGIGHTTSFPTFKQEMMQCFHYFQTLTDIIEIKDLTSLKINIYPNPTTCNFILELSGELLSDKVSVDIYGIRGEKILTETLNGERKHEFSLSGKPSGVYFIRVISGDKTETVKIIKQ